MRIISQNGEYDIPYEKMLVQHSNEKVIAYDINLEGDGYLTLGFYQTEKRSSEVTDEIRKHFDAIKRAEFGGCENEYYVSQYYQMPKE